ncbi:MAG: hypothetical protein ACRDMX_10710 [Solirubrobacteraceae bacterium]
MGAAVSERIPTSPEAVAGIAAGTITGPALFAYWDGPSPDGFSGLSDLTAATLTGPSGSVPVDIVDDRQTDQVPAGAGIVIPVAPLTPGASYTATVTFSTSADAATPRSFTHSFSSTASGPPQASKLIHINAVPFQGRDVFVMTADFPAAGEQATESVTSSDPSMHISGGRGQLATSPNAAVYPLQPPAPGAGCA